MLRDSLNEENLKSIPKQKTFEKKAKAGKLSKKLDQSQLIKSIEQEKKHSQKSH